MVVRNTGSIFVNTTTKNYMCKIISFCCNIHSSVNEVMRVLSSNYGVHHNWKVSTGRVLHTNRNVHSTGCQTVLLVLYRTGTDCLIRKDIVKIASVLRIKHLVCGCQSCLFDRADMHSADCNDTLKKVWSLIRIRLMEHSLISFSCCTWFVCINTRNDHQTVWYLLVHFCKTIHIVAHRIFIVCGTWSHDNNKFIGFSFKNLPNLRITFLLDLCQFFRKRVFRLQVCR